MTRYFRWVVPFTIFGTTLTGSVVGSWAPSDPRRVAAVFPPWWSAAAVLAAASDAGQVAAAGRLPFIVAVTSEREDLPQVIRAAGAILVFDQDGSSLCLGRKEP